MDNKNENQIKKLHGLISEAARLAKEYKRPSPVVELPQSKLVTDFLKKRKQVLDSVEDY